MRTFSKRVSRWKNIPLRKMCFGEWRFALLWWRSTDMIVEHRQDKRILTFLFWLLRMPMIPSPWASFLRTSKTSLIIKTSTQCPIMNIVYLWRPETCISIRPRNARSLEVIYKKVDVITIGKHFRNFCTKPLPGFSNLIKLRLSVKENIVSPTFAKDLSRRHTSDPNIP